MKTETNPVVAIATKHADARRAAALEKVIELQSTLAKVQRDLEGGGDLSWWADGVSSAAKVNAAIVRAADSQTSLDSIRRVADYHA